MRAKNQKATKQRNAKAAIFLALLFCVVPGCVAPDAIKTDIQGIRNDMGKMEKLVEQKANSSVVAEKIEQVNNRIEQTNQVAEELSLWRKSVQAETINYGGAGWVVVGTGVIVFIFVAAGLLLIRAFMRRGSMLSLITAAVQRVGKRSPETIHAIKEQIHEEVKKGRCTHKHRKCLGVFAKKTFEIDTISMAQKAELDV